MGWDDLENGGPRCLEQGIRAHAGVCDCNLNEFTTGVDETDCRVCSKGCANCALGPFGRGECLECLPNYALVADMSYLCMFIPDQDNVPMGYTLVGIDNDRLITGRNWSQLFKLDLTQPLRDLEEYLDIHNDRHDSINHATRGMWFDGKYDHLEFQGVLPPRFGANFWVKPYHDGTLISTSAIHDDANQHLINAGIRGKRLESSVEYGDDLSRPDQVNQLSLSGGNSGFVTPGSIHENSPYIPIKRYSQTDMDVIDVQVWEKVGFVWDYDRNDDNY